MTSVSELTNANNPEVVERKRSSFMKTIVLIESDFLDKPLIKNYLLEAGYEEDDELVEWNTGWRFSTEAQKLSSHLVFKGVPSGIDVIIRL